MSVDSRLTLPGWFNRQAACFSAQRESLFPLTSPNHPNLMNTKVAIKLTVVGAAIVAAGYFLRGHDILTAIAFLLLLLLVTFKVSAALILHRRRGGFPPGNDGGHSSKRPAPWPPAGSPPSLSAAEKLKHDPA
jgi:hypothetical protein